MWIFAIWMYLLFCSLVGGNPASQAAYESFKANGAPCYVYIAAWGNDDSPQPDCWYDPSNTNPGR